jgi:hypothetical protein
MTDTIQVLIVIAIFREWRELVGIVILFVRTSVRSDDVSENDIYGRKETNPRDGEE